MIAKISHNSNEYHQSVILRDEILRAPIGLQFSVEELQNEADQLIYGYFENESLISTVQFVINDDKAKLRQFATKPSYQNQGIGTQLYKYCEESLKKNGVSEIYCHCREKALSFYMKNGYEIVSEEFIEVGIKHWEMRKSL